MATKNSFYRIGRDAMEGMIEALKSGRPLTRREVIVDEPPGEVTPHDIVSLRTDVFGVSQHVFARMLNVSTKTLQSWEQGRNTPTGATLRLIEVVRQHPRILQYRSKASRKPGKWRVSSRSGQKA
jgi:putative transcriptional regulator